MTLGERVVWEGGVGWASVLIIDPLGQLYMEAPKLKIYYTILNYTILLFQQELQMQYEFQLGNYTEQIL